MAGVGASAPRQFIKRGYMLVVGTTYVLGDEWALALAEVNKISPDSKSWRRCQFIRVVRDDKIHEYMEVLGETSEFTGIGQFTIPGGVIENDRVYLEHTVDELKEMANQIRGNPPADLKELVNQQDIIIA